MAEISKANVLANHAAYCRFQKAGAVADNDFNGEAAPGATAVDTTNGELYINTGTKAATVWVLVGDQASV